MNRSKPEVRYKINAENVKQTPVMNGKAESNEPKTNTNVRPDDLVVVLRTEHRGIGVEVYSCIWI